eukprot:CAMPEP_0114449710 /NCGR_PEP_ID=MMETSP0104-20121206/76_1 /TAXON_ID=37642 ORGANISM="Paraphysomonas imperforata, Strain PA2" /NCGR_SAMPLE_ID=MMETSP0104 /ASSEMBLY_ACC=CAM_ASM_000202 /LENGTH=512 /DNA_ID=CAMNT_0001621811 /DNA_START=41 /DNA_END=1579 /DNA_ORIENTATION=-
MSKAGSGSTLMLIALVLLMASRLTLALSEAPTHIDRASLAYKRMHLHCLSLTSQRQERISDENIRKQLHNNGQKKPHKKKKGIKSDKRGLLSIADQMKMLTQPTFQNSDGDGHSTSDVEKSAIKSKGNNKDFFMKRNIPTWNCPLEERVGGLNDGAKWVCDVDLIVSPITPSADTSNQSAADAVNMASNPASPPCLVYSFGSNGNFVFEKGLLDRQRCEIHIFDFDNFTSFDGMFSSVSDQDLVHFHNWGLGKTSFSVDFSTLDKPNNDSKLPFNADGVLNKHLGRYELRGGRRGRKDSSKRIANSDSIAGNEEAGKPNIKEFFSLTDIVDMLGHRGRTLSLLKVDVEGAEFGVLDDHVVWSELRSREVIVEQILVEVHATGVGKNYRWRPEVTEYGVEAIDNLLARLTTLGYAIFHKEVNLMSTALSCAEFGLVKLDIKCPASYTKLAKALSSRVMTSSTASSGSSVHLKNKKRAGDQISLSSIDLMPTVHALKKEVAASTIDFPMNRFIY